MRHPSANTRMRQLVVLARQRHTVRQRKESCALAEPATSYSSANTRMRQLVVLARQRHTVRQRKESCALAEPATSYSKSIGVLRLVVPAARGGAALVRNLRNEFKSRHQVHRLNRVHPGELVAATRRVGTQLPAPPRFHPDEQHVERRKLVRPPAVQLAQLALRLVEQALLR